MASLPEARAALGAARRLVVLTGAGVSAASGIPTFRGAGGMWKRYRPEELASPAAFRRAPELVWSWYALRLKLASEAEPNAAHLALVQLERGREVTVVTQNVDGLHHRAGSRRVLELHGSLLRSRCTRCHRRELLTPGFGSPPRCPDCGAPTRPDVVWFGEALPLETFEEAVETCREADLALVIGTSAVVEPAASLGRLAAACGACLIEINPEATPLTPFADLSLRTGAVEGMAALLASDQER